MILINGEQRDTLEITDRGLHYGDGLFETLEIIQGQPVFLTQHYQNQKS
jgi:4-amino-4-deoxychorismate lyase